ncbi:MAG: hypothetical protein HQ581_20605 [Planctomycetes bacterium]|nr:hypothetical protein [Planctomycetota bacterium]
MSWRMPSLINCCLALGLFIDVGHGAELRLAKVFTDGAVLQSGQNVPVWGWADPKAEVTVTFAGRKVSANADKVGKWMVRLAPLAVSADGNVLEARSGDHVASARDVLVGDVWLCSGQSNMEWPVKKAAEQEWQRRNTLLKQRGKNPLPRPKTAGDPNFIHRASGLWNGAVAPLIPYALRGIIWYQGETNERRGFRYRIEFPLLISSWRAAWQRPELPFLYVQVANVLPPDPAPAESEWAELRESQAMALELPRTGMAVTIDIGEANDVHPKNKQDVGYRLALQARARVYGEDIPHASPSLESHTVEGARIRIRFKHTHGGLKTKQGAPLKGFAISGEDHKYVYAEAKIERETVVVWSEKVKKPIAVRYAWANNPEGCNLYSAADLPAAPFRTDTWPAKTQEAKKLVIDDMWK